MSEEENKIIELQIARFKDLKRTFYKNRPYIQIEREDVIYKKTIDLFDKLLKEYKLQQKEIEKLIISNKELDKECSRLERKEVEMQKEIEQLNKDISNMYDEEAVKLILKYDCGLNDDEIIEILEG